MDNKNLYTLAFLYTGIVLVLYSTSLATAVKIRSKVNISYIFRIRSFLVCHPYWENPWKNPQKPANPSCGCGFGEGMNSATQTPTPRTPTRNPWRVSKPVLFPRCRGGWRERMEQGGVEGRGEEKTHPMCHKDMLGAEGVGVVVAQV
jgi:hypothetical protein